MSDDATKRLVGYYEAGDIGAKQYFVTDIPGDLLTHVIYAFANVTVTQSGAAVVSVDAKDDGINFPLLSTLKTNYAQLRVLISVGGANHSTNFSAVASDDGLLTQFVQSSVQFMTENGFDGIDIDWEFPGPEDSANFTTLLQQLRGQLDAQGEADGCHYLLTIAAPAGQQHIVNLQLPQIYPVVDWINLETYDFSTASSHKTNFVAPLFTEKGDLNVDAAVKSYLAGGVPADKIVLGLRFVGTGWQGVPSTNKGLYQSVTGPAPGTWDKAGSAPTGSLGYQDIEDNYLGTYTRSWDKEAQAPWLYNADTGIMISYEDPQSLTAKVNYAVSNGLGGVMIWELGSDDSAGTLVNAVSTALSQALSV
ncbi:glycoside hydrolase family 18 protein [Nevskia soli]|uniref:glycoside hydrolase family 18 protein n=1 Tax=Nevskia soli TaxID=418856 RepID=UPI0015D771F6|nr:glycoside hydrolase family 18 protein [Nevskia soli]